MAEKSYSPHRYELQRKVISYHWPDSLAQTIKPIPSVSLINIEESNDPWYNQGQVILAAAKARKPITDPAKNIIIFIGDAMSPAVFNRRY